MARLQNLDLHSVSRWVWVLIALAVAWFLLALASAASVDASVAYAAFIGSVPALYAAALMYVAPQERLVGIAALCFAVPLAANAFIGAVIMLAANTLSSDYAYLGPRFSGAASAFGYIGWVFPIVAIFAIGMHIGPVRTRITSAIVAAGVVMALLQVAAIIASASQGLPIEQLLTGVLAQSVWIAWAYLLAAAFGQGMPLLALAAVANLLSGALTFLSFSLLQAEIAGDTSAPVAQVLLAALWALGVIAWAALIAGILRELPRTGDSREAESVPRVLSVGR